MNITKSVEKKEVTKTIVEVVEIPTVTITLSTEEASLLRTSSYIVKGKLTRDSQLHKLYSGMYASLCEHVRSANVSNIEQQFRS